MFLERVFLSCMFIVVGVVVKYYFFLKIYIMINRDKLSSCLYTIRTKLNTELNIMINHYNFFKIYHGVWF